MTSVLPKYQQHGSPMTRSLSRREEGSISTRSLPMDPMVQRSEARNSVTNSGAGNPARRRCLTAYCQAGGAESTADRGGTNKRADKNIKEVGQLGTSISTRTRTTKTHHPRRLHVKKSGSFRQNMTSLSTLTTPTARSKTSSRFGRRRQLRTSSALCTRLDGRRNLSNSSCILKLWNLSLLKSQNLTRPHLPEGRFDPVTRSPCPGRRNTGIWNRERQWLLKIRE
jgi:hypothetical protein